MALTKKLKPIWIIRIAAILLIIVGVAAVIRYGIGTFYAFREMQYARQNNFNEGNLDPSLLRPWMNMQYVAVAYAVPQEYLFSELGIPFERRNSRISLDDLNEMFHFGRAKTDPPKPLIMDRLAQAIEDYRANPVPTGLEGDGVRFWMSIQYIANSTGIPVETIFKELNLEEDGNAYIPLEYLVDEIKYPGGPRALYDKLQQIIDTYEAAE